MPLINFPEICDQIFLIVNILNSLQMAIFIQWFGLFSRKEQVTKINCFTFANWQAWSYIQHALFKAFIICGQNEDRQMK